MRFSREGGRVSAYEEILKAVRDAVFVTTSDGTVAECNPGAMKLLGDGFPDPRGRNIISLLSPGDGDMLSSVKVQLQSREHAVIETRCRIGDKEFRAEISAGQMGADGGGNLCFVVRDISARYNAQQDLQHALERVQAISRIRMEFVSNVSHELRTPLTSMIYAVRNMQNGHAGVLGERAMQYLERLESDCTRLLGTVNDILDLRQIENNTLVLAKSAAPVSAIVRSAAESLRLQAQSRKIKISFARVKTVLFSECDRRKMERVFINLIGNAVKYTPEGGQISLSVTPSEDGATVNAVVEDTGIGIPPEALKKVATRYYQVGEQAMGTGLGLAISKELVDLHGGSMSIESPPPGKDCGTRVTVSLGRLPSPMVLLVSSEGRISDFVMHTLQSLSVDCELATSGHAAIRRALESEPGLAVIGRKSDDLTQCDILVQFKNDRRLSRMPVVVLTDKTTSIAERAVIRAFKAPVASVEAGAGEFAASLFRNYG